MVKRQQALILHLPVTSTVLLQKSPAAKRPHIKALQTLDYAPTTQDGALTYLLLLS